MPFPQLSQTSGVLTFASFGAGTYGALALLALVLITKRLDLRVYRGGWAL